MGSGTSRIAVREDPWDVTFPWSPVFIKSMNIPVDLKVQLWEMEPPVGTFFAMWDTCTTGISPIVRITLQASGGIVTLGKVDVGSKPVIVRTKLICEYGFRTDTLNLIWYDDTIIVVRVNVVALRARRST